MQKQISGFVCFQNRFLKKMNKLIPAKLLTLSMLICGFGFSIYAQQMPATGGKMPGDNGTMNKAKSVSPAEAAKNALNVGAEMPKFRLADANGETVESRDLLKLGNLVVVFYRGSWCPFCNLYLRTLQKNLTQIKEAGGNLVAISVENPDYSLSVAKNDALR